MQRSMRYQPSSTRVVSTHKEPASTDFSSLEMCLDFIAVIPICANDEIDLIDDQVEPDTTVDDRLYQFEFFKPCLSKEFLKAMPFCFNPKLAFLKSQHVVTTIFLEKCAFEHSQRGFSKQLVSFFKQLLSPFYLRAAATSSQQRILTDDRPSIASDSPEPSAMVSSTSVM